MPSMLCDAFGEGTNEFEDVKRSVHSVALKGLRRACGRQLGVVRGGGGSCAIRLDWRIRGVAETECLAPGTAVGGKLWPHVTLDVEFVETNSL
jgi:hypothetical protein